MAITDKLFKRKKQQKKISMAYKMLFDKENPYARIVLKDMCLAHGVFDGGFSVDPYEHAFNNGERNTVLRILTILNMSLEDIVELSEDTESAYREEEK